jgi:hypothetical protein
MYIPSIHALHCHYTLHYTRINGRKKKRMDLLYIYKYIYIKYTYKYIYNNYIYIYSYSKTDHRDIDINGLIIKLMQVNSLTTLRARIIIIITHHHHHQ